MMHKTIWTKHIKTTTTTDIKSLLRHSVTYNIFRSLPTSPVSMAGAFRYVNAHAENRTEQLLVYWTLICQSLKLTNPSEVGGTNLLSGATPEKESHLQVKAPFLTVMLLFIVGQWHSTRQPRPTTRRSICATLLLTFHVNSLWPLFIFFTISLKAFLFWKLLETWKFCLLATGKLAGRSNIGRCESANFILG